MRQSIRILPAIVAAAAGAAVFAAQDHDAKPQMALVIIDQVKPSMKMQFEEATKEKCALLTKHDADPNLVGFFTVSGPEFGYAFIIPLQDGFASMAPTRQNWMTTVESIGKDRWKAISAKAEACVESRSMIHTVYREDLSYVPKNPSVKEEDVKFAQYDFLYTFPDKQEDFEEIAKEWQALYARQGVTTGWHVYEHITGEDLPVYMIVKVAASEADYHNSRVVVQEQLGEDAKALGERSSQLIRKMESQVGYPRPELSYPTMPE